MPFPDEVGDVDAGGIQLMPGIWWMGACGSAARFHAAAKPVSISARAATAPAGQAERVSS